VTAVNVERGGRSLLQRRRGLIPLLLLAPGVLWLGVFYVYPAFQMFLSSFWTGSLEKGFTFSLSNWTTYPEAISRYQEQFVRSILYAGAATILTFLIAYPLAWTIAFKGGRWKNLLIFLVIAPFFTSFLLRTLSWQTILSTNSVVYQFFVKTHLLNLLQAGPYPLITGDQLLNTPLAVITGLTYNFLPFMVLPLFASLDRIDVRLLEAGADLYGRPWTAFRKVTWPLSLPGVVAGTLLTFIPAAGDYINSKLLGNPNTAMIGQVIDGQFLRVLDYPTAAALSFTLMAAILVLVSIYVWRAGTEELV
jgi:spermidine/putrescine transport system permease protein